MAARVAIAKAQRQLAVEAGVHLCVRGFSVINTVRLAIEPHVTTSRPQRRTHPAAVPVQVGAVSLDARLDCEAFASAHRATSHFDRSSFVGLAWRPPNKAICCEVYSTGRANLPGSVAERMLQASWRDMLPELLAFSTARAQLRLFPEAKDYKDLLEQEGSSSGQPAQPAALTGWDDWTAGGADDEGELASGDGEVRQEADGDDEIDDDMLGALGL